MYCANKFKKDNSFDTKCCYRDSNCGDLLILVEDIKNMIITQNHRSRNFTRKRD